MKTSLTYGIIALLAFALVIPSPILALAKDNGNGKENKSEKSIRKELKKDLENIKIAKSDQKDMSDSDDDEDRDDEKYERNSERKDARKNNANKVSWVGCVTKSFGHLIAPGWIKKNGSISLSEDCSLEGMPKGIMWLYGYHSTSTPATTTDTTAPVITNVAATSTSKSSAVITWNTNEKANSVVFYSTNSPATTNGLTKSNGTLTKNHHVALSNLSANTTYYVVVRSRDASGNISTSSEISFKTPLVTVNDTSAPVISAVTIGSITHNSARISWSTNELTNTKVWYSTSSPVAIGSTSQASVTGFDWDHTVNLNNLVASTTYFAVIESKDQSGNTSTSSPLSFTTLQTPTSTPVAPVITNIVATVGTSTVNVTWNTDIASDSSVFYSTTTPVDVLSSSTASTTNSSLVTSHHVNVTGLATSTTYYFIVQSKDAIGTPKNSVQFSLVTSN